MPAGERRARPSTHESPSNQPNTLNVFANCFSFANNTSSTKPLPITIQSPPPVPSVTIRSPPTPGVQHRTPLPTFGPAFARDTCRTSIFSPPSNISINCRPAATTHYPPSAASPPHVSSRTHPANASRPQATKYPSSPAIQLSPHICDNARQIPTHIPIFLLSDRVSRLDVAVDACLKAPAATLATH